MGLSERNGRQFPRFTTAASRGYLQFRVVYWELLRGRDQSTGLAQMEGGHEPRLDLAQLGPELDRALCGWILGTDLCQAVRWQVEEALGACHLVHRRAALLQPDLHAASGSGAGAWVVQGRQGSGGQGERSAAHSLHHAVLEDHPE